MTRYLTLLALAVTLFATGTPALAGKRCPWNDKEQPEKSTICKGGTIHRCEDGQWISLGTKCTARYQEDARADASGLRRVLGAARPQNDRILARIAPAS